MGLNTAWLFIYSPYLRCLRETADGSCHASAIKRNLCRFLCHLASLHCRFSCPILMSLPTQRYPLYNRCAYSNCPSWILFISVIFQPQLRASCLRLRWLPSCIKMLRTVCMWPAATVFDYNIKNIRNNIRHTRNILEKRLHSTHKCRAHSHSSQSLMGINKSEP